MQHLYFHAKMEGVGWWGGENPHQGMATFLMTHSAQVEMDARADYVTDRITVRLMGQTQIRVVCFRY